MEEKPPAYVAMIMSPSIQIENLDKIKRDDLERQGVVVERDWGYSVVRFADSGENLLENPNLCDLLRRLNDAGVLFCEDYKQGWAPADVMRELQTRGIISECFTAIAWRGPGDWFTTLHKGGKPAA